MINAGRPVGNAGSRRNIRDKQRSQDKAGSKNALHGRAMKREPHVVPVLMRGATYTMPQLVRGKPTVKARRQFTFALDIPGAELRLPALPQIRVGMRLVSGALTVLLATLLYFLWTMPNFHVSQADVVGLQRLTSRDVNTVLNLGDVPIFTLDTKTIEKNLRGAFPEFSSVKVDVGFPNSLSVQVNERIPILKWKQGNRTILIDANGYAFPERGLQEQGPSLTVEAISAPPSQIVDQVTPGLAQAQFLPVEMVSGILSLGALVPTNTPVVYDAENGGLGWKDSRGWSVYFGDASDIDLKMNLYKAIIAKLKREDVKPVLISVCEMVFPPLFEKPETLPELPLANQVKVEPEISD